MFRLLKDYRICMAGSRSDQIPVHAVHAAVEAAVMVNFDTVNGTRHWLRTDGVEIWSQ